MNERTNERIAESLTTEEARLLYRIRNVKDGHINIGVTRRRGNYRTIVLQRERGRVEIIRSGEDAGAVEKFSR